MTSGADDKRQTLSCTSKRREMSGAEKLPSRVHPKSYKGKRLIVCSSKNIPTECNIYRGKEVIRLNKEVMIEMTQEQNSNYWRGMRGYKLFKWQQQVIAVPNPYSVNTAKPFIPDNYNTRMELNKIKIKMYFTKAPL